MTRGNWYNADQRKDEAKDWIYKMEEKYEDDIMDSIRCSNIYEDDQSTKIFNISLEKIIFILYIINLSLYESTFHIINSVDI